MDYGLSSGKIVYLSSAGNVGIGTTSPAYKLDVEGSIRATSNMYANQLFFEQGSARLVFDSASGATWIQGVSGMPMRLAGMSATDLPDLYMLADKTRVSGDFVVGGRLYVPSYSGNQVYYLYICNAPVSGEAPSGVDETELWDILSEGGSGERIAKAHMPSDVLYTDDIQPLWYGRISSTGATAKKGGHGNHRGQQVRHGTLPHHGCAEHRDSHSRTPELHGRFGRLHDTAEELHCRHTHIAVLRSERIQHV